MAEKIAVPTTTQRSVRQDRGPVRLSRRSIRWRHVRRLVPLLTFLLFLGGWQLLVLSEIYPQFLIPEPVSVAEAFMRVAVDGSLLKHTLVTLEEMLLGLFFGVSLALLLGYVLAKSPLLEDLLSPLIVAFQSTPIVAYAPLLVIWFGSGTTSKIVTCAVIVFFPMLINTIVGLRNVSRGLTELMRMLRASRWQMFIKLEVPAALPVLLAGLKTSATLAVIGAVVGEFVSAGSGLGYLVNIARSQYNTPLVLVAVFTMTILALSLYLFVSLLEWRLLAWQRRARS